MKTNKYTTRKYNGDDSLSWAVFREADIPKGHRGIVFYGEAAPLMSGCSRPEAQYHCSVMNTEEKAKAGDR